jgi:glutamyl aminopeptidase
LKVERFTLTDRRLGSLIKTVCGKFVTALQLQEMQQFFEKYPNAGAGKNARKK